MSFLTSTGLFFSRYQHAWISLAGSLLLWAAWPTSSLTFLIFIAWLPLLWLEDNVSSGKKFMILTFLHMLGWNLAVTWWVANSTITGGLSAFLANSLLMCLPIWLFRQTKQRLGRSIGYISLAVYWLSFEYIHFNWDLSWPWLTLGNVFSQQTSWVQWYEYTGASGGSGWVLLSNILAYQAFIIYRHEGRTRKYFLLTGGWITVLLLPVLISSLLHAPAAAAGSGANVVIVQPNIDPWDEKFEAGKQEGQLQKLIQLSEQQIDESTALVVWPETAVPVGVDEDQLTDNFFLKPLFGFIERHPRLSLLTGMEGYRQFSTSPGPYAREIASGGGFYETYNSAVLLDSQSIQFYHKSRLVPGVEVLPAFLRFMSPVFEKFGGTAGGYARDTAAVVLATANRHYRIAPAVCYESIYGEYLASFIRKGANLICVITNDGWWGDTQGYRQHMSYARLRAIETRKWIARSANTGISCFIDPSGRVWETLAWNRSGAIKLALPANEGLTFFVKHGDIISKTMLLAGLLLLLWLTVKVITRKRQARPEKTSLEP